MGDEVGGQELKFQVTWHKWGVQEPLLSRKLHDTSLQPTSFFSHTCHLDCPPQGPLSPTSQKLAAIRVPWGPRGIRATLPHLQARVMAQEARATGPTSVLSRKGPVPSTGLQATKAACGGLWTWGRWWRRRGRERGRQRSQSWEDAWADSPCSPLPANGSTTAPRTSSHRSIVL